jgi:hypothetical protein
MTSDAMIFNVGPRRLHRLMHADITTGAVAELMGSERADVIYSEPPSCKESHKYWYSINGSVRRTSWAEFLNAFCDVCASFRTPDAPVFVEMGVQGLRDLDLAMQKVGLVRQRIWGEPQRFAYAFIYVDTIWLERYFDQSSPPSMASALTKAVLSAVVLPGMIVLDPCTGKGVTARHTHRLGGRFRGCELNQNRLDVAVDWLRKQFQKVMLAFASSLGAWDQIERVERIVKHHRLAFPLAVVEAIGPSLWPTHGSRRGTTPQWC